MVHVTYQGVIHGAEGNYGILFPDLPGCVSAGDTMSEVKHMGAEALAFHLQGMIDDGEVVPEPQEWTLAEVDAWLRRGEDEEVNFHLVRIEPISVDPTVRDHVRVDVPRSLAEEVAELNLSVGTFIVEATRRELERLKKSA
jgi:predicted RNase H-like HicB family nuclease